MKKVKIFISWFGNYSRKVAKELRDLLNLLYDAFELFMSESDINPSADWEFEIDNQQHNTDVMIAILTAKSIRSSAVNYEIGRMGTIKTPKTKVYTILAESTLKSVKIGWPLNKFPHAKLDRNGVQSVSEDIWKNYSCSSTNQVLNSFRKRWGNFEVALKLGKQDKIKAKGSTI